MAKLLNSVLLASALLLLSSSVLSQNPIKVGMLTFAVFSQPAPKAVEVHYYKVGEPFTFLPGSIVDYLGVGGSMPVLIAFDMDKDKIDWILKRVDGVVFTSGHTATTGGYHETLKFVVNWAVERNKKGFYFPILALGNGAEQLIQAELGLANSKETVVDCTKVAPTHIKTASATKDVQSSIFWGKDTLGEAVTKNLGLHSMYYTVDCVITAAKFQASGVVNANYKILAEDSNSNVVIFEHKTYPFFAAHFHPEKTLFERGELYHFVDRSEHATDLARAIIKRLVDLVTEKGNPKTYKKISNQIKQYFGIFRPSEYPATSEYERIYTFQRFRDGY